MKETIAEKATKLYAATIHHRRDLIARGMTPRVISAAVASGQLIRIRRDHYAAADIDPLLVEAIRAGGRLSCLSLLQRIGVFVLTCTDLHVHVAPGSSRRGKVEKGTVRHWNAWSNDRSRPHLVPLADAVLQAVRCQPPRAAIATLDSLVHHGLMTEAALRELFTRLPMRYQVLLPLIDGSAASGPETFMRLILRALGVPFETQVLIPGVGTVDFVVDGWLIIECDSKEFHSDWDQQLKDRHRDIVAASLGYVTVRPVASEIMHESPRIHALVAQIIQTLGPRLAPKRRTQLRRNPGTRA